MDNISMNVIFLKDLLEIIFENNKIPIQWLSDRCVIKTYSYVHKMVKLMAEKGLINITKSGRVNFLELTDKGVKVLKLLRQLFNEVDLRF